MECVEIAGDYRAQWGEGPLWWQGRLLYVDIEGKHLLEYDPATDKVSSWDVSGSLGRVGTVVPRANSDAQGELLLAGDAGIHYFNKDAGESTLICDPEPDIAANRFNDGKCSPDGRFFAGTISTIKKEGSASLYRLDPDLSLHTAFTGVTNSNGIVWSGDSSTCYYIDTPRREVLAFDYCSETGALSAVRTAFATDHIDASPDGMTIDSNDNLWIAFCHGGCVVCYNPHSGNQVHRIDLPCLETTACAFGGKNLDELYVTTGIHKDIEEPDAGRLLRITGLGAKGVPANAFLG